jgi:hypothetical protein
MIIALFNGLSFFFQFLTWISCNVVFGAALFSSKYTYTIEARVCASLSLSYCAAMIRNAINGLNVALACAFALAASITTTAGVVGVGVICLCHIRIRQSTSSSMYCTMRVLHICVGMVLKG